MSRFIRRGVSQFLFTPTIADILNVTRGEIAAAENITDRVASVAGWALTNQSVPTPDYGSTFDGSIPGIDGVDTSSFTFYEDLDNEDIEDMFPALTEGYVIILRKGDKPGSNSMDVFPVRVPVKSNEFDDSAAARFSVSFNITRKPALDRPVPDAAPTVSSINPFAGAAAGGQAGVVITGFALTGATSVKLGGVEVAAKVVNSDTQITVTTGAHAAGLVDLVVVTPNGTATKVGAYQYV